MSEEARKLADQLGGVWRDHPDFPSKDWKYEVSNGDTRAGYWDWVLSRLEEAKA